VNVLYRYFQAVDDDLVFFRVNLETNEVQHAIVDWSREWRSAKYCVYSSVDQLLASLDREDLVEIDYDPTAKRYDCPDDNRFNPNVI
jgi:hypothetical protein